MDRLFKIFDIDGTKNREVTRFALLKLEINRHMERINVVVMDLNGIDIFLEYNWLVKHNLEVNWNKDALKKLNAKTYAITVKKDKVLNQWLEKQLKTRLIVESSSW